MSRDRDIIYSGAPAFSLAVVQKSKTQTLVWLLARKFTRAVFWTLQNLKPMIWKTVSLATLFLLAGLSFIMYNYKIQAQQNKILLPVPHSAVIFFS